MCVSFGPSGMGKRSEGEREMVASRLGLPAEKANAKAKAMQLQLQLTTRTTFGVNWH